MAVVHKVDYEGNSHEHLSLFVWNNNGTIENCASIADSMNVAMDIYPGMATNNYSSGVIENCYSYIGDWFGDWYPFGVVTRMGLCWQNWGVIKNCYYNTWSYNEYGMWHDEEAVVASYEGEITEIMNFEPTPYFQSPFWELKDSVSVTSSTGYVYRTNELGEALLDWVLGQDNSEFFNYWCYESATFLPNNLPVLCDLDITNVKEDVEEKLTVYPNPAKDIVRIDGVEPAEVKVYNALGQLVKTVHGTNEISVDGLSKGVYLLHIQDKRGMPYSERIMVTR